MAVIGDVYGGAGYSLDENYGEFVGYRLPVEKIGTSLRPDTANQITEASNILNQGFKTIEVGAISTDIFNTIPQQHFKELNRMQKLTGSKASLHAPIQGIEASGIIQDTFTEMNRKAVERQLMDVIDKAHDMDPEGNVPVTMHSANMAGTTFTRGPEGEFKEAQIVAINRKTGRVEGAFREEERAYPEEIEKYGKPQVRSAKEQLKIANDSQWINSIDNLSGIKKNTDEVIARVFPPMVNLVQKESQGIDVMKEGLNPNEENARRDLQKANIFLSNVGTSFRAMFEEAYKYSDGKSKDQLNAIAKDWVSRSDELEKAAFETDKEGKKITANINLIEGKSKLLDNALFQLAQLKDTPRTFIPIEEFAMDKSSTTFGNVAFHSYDKYGKNAPIVGIENLYPGMAFSNPKEFKKLVETSREKFVEKAQSEGYSKSEAQRAAKEVIGVTWDVGHLNMLRKEGFKEEDLTKATKLIAKDIKHIHLTDNFGFADSHLPHGMGNVPIKKHLEILEKAGVLDKSMVINEIGGFVNQFKQSPFPYMLEAFGAPVGGGTGVQYWNQAVWSPAGYYSGVGNINPDIHHRTFGRSFAGLPTELGGQVPGQEASRATGTPLA